MKKVAVIGSGYIGLMHAQAIKKSKRLALAAFVNRNIQNGKKAAKEFSVPFYADAEEMIKKENPDILDICLPSSLHEHFTLLGAAYKKHVICEKPFSLSSASCRRMSKACAGAGVKLMAAQVLRWFPEYQKIKELLPKLGNLHGVYCNRLAQHPNWTTWHRDPAVSGGGLFDLHLHDIDFLYSVFGELDHVYAAGWKSPSGCWNQVMSTLVFKNGVKAVCEGCCEMTGAFPFSAALRAVGDNGTINYELSAGFNIENLGAASNKLTLFEKGKKPKAVPWKAQDGFKAELEAFAEAVEKNTAVPISPDESIYGIKILEAIERSLETGKVEKIK
ncbi:MAG: Gfo/Idh/MocA family oxidoreductase [Treponema sp.]|jgi:predicted dehydrogenase|nr:Gfo/Idh/MocA family oxidoreductase [Treponema sp.]